MPGSTTTDITPADLRGAMPAWEATISEEDRWNVVNYIRSMGLKEGGGDD